MITQYRVRNFKNLVDLGEDFRPQPLNVIIGPNGCGKTSLLQSIDFLRAFFLSSLELYTQEKGWSLRDIANVRETGRVVLRQNDGRVIATRRPSVTTWDVEANLPADPPGNGAGVYRYSVSLATRISIGIVTERLSYEGAGSEEVALLERDGREVTLLNRDTSQADTGQVFSHLSSLVAGLDGTRDRSRFPELLHFREWIERFRLFAIWDPKILRAPNRGKHLELGPNGEHLASLLALLEQKKPAEFTRLQNRVTRVFPHIRNLSLTGGRGWGWRVIQQQEEIGNRKASIASQHMSDGVLQLLAVASLLYLDNIPSVIMFEEPENGVHPQLLREVVSILKELSLQKPPRECQVFFTTHSPYVLDEFYDSPEDVFVMDRGVDGKGSSINQLSSSHNLPSIREGFASLGEAWFSSLIGGTAVGG